MRKKVLLFVLSAFTAIATWATGGHSTLVVELKDGTLLNCILYIQNPSAKLQNDTLLISVHEITYPDPNNPTIESGGVSPEPTIFTYAVGKVKKFYFKMYDPNIIENVMEDEKTSVWIKQMDGQTLTISGTETDDRIAIYSVDGRLMQSGISSDGDETTLSIGSLKKGIYIIRVSNKVSFKIMKQ